MEAFFLWSFVNLVDGEAGWFLFVVGALTSAAIITHCLKIFINKLHDRFVSTDQLWKDAAIAALYQPLSVFIWVVVIAQCIDIVSDQFLSQMHLGSLRLFFKMAVVVATAWFLMRLKKNIVLMLNQKSIGGQVGLTAGQIASLSKLITLVVVAIIILIGMDLMGLNPSTIIAFGGISGLAIAFAGQEIISNFFGGLMVHINQPFVAGELIQLPNSNVLGVVKDIGWYQTRLVGTDQHPFFVPNSLFTKAVVVNITRRSRRLLNEILSLRHEDSALISQILAEIRTLLQGSEGVDTRCPIVVNVALVGLASIDIRFNAVLTYTDDLSYFRFRDQVIMKVLTIITASGARLATDKRVVVQMEK